MSADADLTPADVALHAWHDSPNVGGMGLWRDVAAAVLAHHAATHQPRVWRTGEPEPGEDVRAVLDRAGYLWARHRTNPRWTGAQEKNLSWASLLGYGPLVEVVFPQAVTE